MSDDSSEGDQEPTRPRRQTIEQARLELKSLEPFGLPPWLEGETQLPFSKFSGDVFEILCFLLLKAENPGQKIVYYGKTKDQGRDIVRWHANGDVELIQCKRFSKNVDASQVKAELAKLVSNLFYKRLDGPFDRVTFYVVPDLTSGAQGLIDDQAKWQAAAEESLKSFLKKTPSGELVSFAKQWWPEITSEKAISLTLRIKAFPDLIDEFFTLRKVVDGSSEDVAKAVVDLLDEREERKTQESAEVCQIAKLTIDGIAPAFTAASRSLRQWPKTLSDGKWIPAEDQVSFAARSLNAFAITDTLLKLIAAAAIMGLSNMPKNG
ncbi:hypothetical protein TBK1r_42210 [Stieleria magnilauensis]|uniref:Restriction endonuclease type IV Mrr domain-containing protein n=1 Tax=Stieleria magnilauensis TaxID=2527963 RepID=A0ABX5XU35_9BACT|nr:hypothetical protein TBK1r_42210 [Planctomycetes bacterium TBK1r]